MKRAAAMILALVVLFVLAAVSYAAGVIPGTDGCTWRSVDKEAYVAKNEAVFSTIRIPIYLREAQENVYSVGVPAMDACLPLENSPPYEAYVTHHVFIQPIGEYPRGYDRRLLGPEWVSLSGGLTRGETFRRESASLYISTTDEATAFSVDHGRGDR